MLLRWLRPTAVQPRTQTRLEKARLYGWAPAPGQPLRFVDPETGESEIRPANSQGWRDVEHAFAKPAGVLRIVFIGDSFTYGTVPIEALYTRRVESKLREREARDVEVVSLGVGGWGTDQELEVLRNEAVRYSPDLIVYQFCSNDLINIDPPPEVREDLSLGLHKPFRYVVDNGVLVRLNRQSAEDARTEGRPVLALVRRSALFRAVASLVPEADVPPPVPDPRNDRATSSSVAARFGIAEENKRWQRTAWVLFEALVRGMNAASRAAGSRFLVFSEAGEEGMRQHLLEAGQLVSEGGADFAVAPGERMAVDMALPLKRLAEICERNGIPLIAPTRVYWRYRTDWHTNRAGNENMADDIVDFLEAWPAFGEMAGRARPLTSATPPGDARGPVSRPAAARRP